jgi:hypothetical protein
MAISLAKARRVGQKRTTSKKMAKDYAAQQKKAKSRGFLSGVLGKGLGSVLGTGLVGALGLTGFGVPLAMALGSMAGKKGAHELTRGIGADPSKISKGDIYGYGKDESEALRAQLKGEMTVDPWKERGGFGKELLSSTVSAGLAGNLGGATKSLMKGDVGGAFVDPKAVKGWAGAKESLAGLIPGYSDTASKAVDPSTIDLEASLEGSGMDLGEYEELVKTRQAGYVDDEDDFWGLGSTVDPNMAYDDTAVSEEIYAKGGQVPDQQQLMQLLALAQMQNEEKAYDNTPLEEVQQPTISEVFESRGKTLGGNNINSLAQMMGK